LTIGSAGELLDHVEVSSDSRPRIARLSTSHDLGEAAGAKVTSVAMPPFALHHQLGEMPIVARCGELTLSGIDVARFARP